MRKPADLEMLLGEEFPALSSKIEVRGRLLRQAGLMPSVGRGRAMLPLTVPDAVSILIATASLELTKDGKIGGHTSAIASMTSDAPYEDLTDFKSAFERILEDPNAASLVESIRIYPRAEKAILQTIKWDATVHDLVPDRSYTYQTPGKKRLTSYNALVAFEYRTPLLVRLSQWFGPDDVGEIIDESKNGSAEHIGKLGEENERLVLEYFQKMLGEENGKRAMATWREKYSI